MSLPRRIPLVVPPVAEESFTGWVTRYAAELLVPVGTLIDHLGLPTRPTAPDARPRWADIWLTPEAVEALCKTTALPPEAFSSAHLFRHNGALLDLRDLEPDDETSLRLVADREWILVGRSRACPQCLDDDGLWRTWWRLGLAAACPHHGVLLVDACNDCGHPLASGARYSRLRRAPDARICARAVKGACCTRDLRSITGVPAPTSVVDAQRRYLNTFGRAKQELAGTEISTLQWRDEWVALMNLCRGVEAAQDASWPEAMQRAWHGECVRLRDSSGGARQMRTPPTAALAGCLMALTESTVAATDTAHADERIGELVRMASTSPRRGLENHRRAAQHLVILGPLVRANEQPQARVAARLAAITTLIDTAHIPTMLNRTEYQDRYAELLPGTAERTGRLYVSLCLARSQERSWRTAGVSIGIEPATAVRLGDVVTRRVEDPHELAGRLTQTGAELNREPTDYRRRRKALSGLIKVDRDTLTTLQRRCVTVARQVNAAAYAWEHGAQSPATWSPAHHAAVDRGCNPESLREVYRRFVKHLHPDDAQRLQHWALNLAGGAP